jgi:hypothetical protein
MHQLWRAAILTQALACLTLPGCGSGLQNAGHGSGESVSRWTSYLCAPNLPGITVSTQDVAMGERVVFAAPPDATEALTKTVLGHVLPQRQDTLGAAPPGPNDLPLGTWVQAENTADGATVTYTGASAAEGERIRQVVASAAQQIRGGGCTLLQAVDRNPGRAVPTEEETRDIDRLLERQDRWRGMR